MKFWTGMKLRWKLALGVLLIDLTISGLEYAYYSFNQYAFENEYFDVWVQVWAFFHRPADRLGAYVFWPAFKFLLPKYYPIVVGVLTIIANFLELPVVFWVVGWGIERWRLAGSLRSESGLLSMTGRRSGQQ